MPPAKSLPKWSDCDNFFWAGNMAGRLQWAGMQTELETAQAGGQAAKDFKLFFAAFPHTAEVKPFNAGGTDVIAYTVGRTNDATIREASFTYANWRGVDDAVQTSWLVEGAFPASKSGVKAVANHPKMADPNIKWVLNNAAAYEAEITGGNYQPIFNPRSSKIFGTLQPDQYNYFVLQLQSVMLGQKTVDGMLKEVAKTINTALGVKV
jgi:ABC-type glycerol-3-phosphate transport system substrate-binding protein